MFITGTRNFYITYHLTQFRYANATSYFSAALRQLEKPETCCKHEQTSIFLAKKLFICCKNYLMREKVVNLLFDNSKNKRYQVNFYIFCTQIFYTGRVKIVIHLRVDLEHTASGSLTLYILRTSSNNVNVLHLTYVVLHSVFTNKLSIKP